ncbi:3-hydroxy-3-methylglutaryl CoA synthase [Fervidicoccus fontis Kam940]|uniref:Hydroxymethylglutaryl-CoA synthase n=1 Tax=Fervidicoccus fontis (strain DSM 19380 / JCM 18336 / VKM B-2539 / Kam940) TaxID=1163730 RepID=I0A002_FERFK|nr:3-hydroxy-3-methylglutaryl CoA synthase [Fervidicoccus fontis Kam940]
MKILIRIFPESKAGIIGWGAYIPIYRIKVEEIAGMWGNDLESIKGLNVEEKSVAGIDEDAITMGYEAAKNAIKRALINPKQIEAVFFGSESKPYAVKPSATVIADALGITPTTMASDLEFACRAGSEGIRASIGLVSSQMVNYALVIGSDTAQANPGDVLEYTASSGAAAFVIGPSNEAVAVFEASYTYVTDTTDFWRRSLSPYPLHGEAFTGDPAYFDHIVGAVKGLLNKTGLKVEDFDYAIFHQPNGKFPLRVAEKLGFPKEKVFPSIVVNKIGNTYNGSALLGLSKILDSVDPGKRILVAPFGSGAGSDAYSIVTTDKIKNKRDLAKKVSDYIEKKTYINYSTYSRYRNLIKKIGV